MGIPGTGSCSYSDLDSVEATAEELCKLSEKVCMHVNFLLILNLYNKHLLLYENSNDKQTCT